MAFLIRKLYRKAEENSRVKNRGPRRVAGHPLPDRLKWAGIVVLLMTALLSSSRLAAEEMTDQQLEYRIKAAFLYNFCQFVTWPDSPAEKADAPFVLSAIGELPFKESFESLSGKIVRGRPLFFRQVSGRDELDRCHLLFVGKTDPREVVALIGQIRNRPILAVGDTEEFTRMGGIMSFLKVDGKIRFEINPKAAEEAGLKISSHLLKLAFIHGEPQPRGN